MGGKREQREQKEQREQRNKGTQQGEQTGREKEPKESKGVQRDLYVNKWITNKTVKIIEEYLSKGMYFHIHRNKITQRALNAHMKSVLPT